jgi:hypothetical protein
MQQVVPIPTNAFPTLRVRSDPWTIQTPVSGSRTADSFTDQRVLPLEVLMDRYPIDQRAKLSDVRSSARDTNPSTRYTLGDAASRAGSR